MIVKYSLMGLIVLCLSAAPLWAQQKENSDRLFQNYITQNQFYVSQITLKSERVFQLTYPECASDIKVTRLKPTVLIPRIFDKEKTKQDAPSQYEYSNIHPSHGQWIERSILNACGKFAQINLLVTAYALDQIPDIYPLINGQTKIDIIAQSKAENIVRQEIKSATKCQSSSFIVGTFFMGFRDPSSNATLSKTDKNAGWVEQWVVNACDKDTVINVAILPDPKSRYKFVAKIKDD